MMKWMARILVGIVFVLNLQCAFAFIFDPALYSPSFELSGEIGEAMVQAMGILFIMWNVPYFFALIDPTKYWISLMEAVGMQAISFVGESILYKNLSINHEILRTSILRFVVFDGLGFLLLVSATIMVYIFSKKIKSQSSD